LLEDFFKIVLGLKKIKRKGWQQKLSIKIPESVADHTLSVIAMAMLFSELKGYDTTKVMKMAVLHDLSESLIGDFVPGEISDSKKIELENKTMDEIIKKLPMPLQDNYLKIWTEYQAKVSKESILVHEIDKLEMVFQAKEYLEQGFSKAQVQPFLDSAQNYIRDSQLKSTLDNILK